MNIVNLYVTIKYMKKAQKGFIIPLIMVVLVLAIGGGSYVYLKKDKAPRDYTSTATSSEAVVGNEEVSGTPNLNSTDNNRGGGAKDTESSGNAMETQKLPLTKKFFNDYRFSVSYPKDWSVKTTDSKPYYSVVNFNGGMSDGASILISSDASQVTPILKSGLRSVNIDAGRTTKTEFDIRGLHVIKWDYVNPGDAGSGSKNVTEWVVVKKCNIDTVYVINDITLFNNFTLLDANGNESGSPDFRLCSMFDANKPFTENREK